MDIVEWGEGVEWEFINMMNKDYSQKLFERNAEVMLGPDWKELGAEIVGKDSQEKFRKYCNGTN